MASATASVKEVQAVNLEELANKTMFLRIEFHRFGNTRTTSLETNSTAKPSRLKHQKVLVASLELKAIEKADTALRNLLDAHYCFDYGTGIRMIPANETTLKSVYRVCTDYEKLTRPVLVRALIDAWDNLVLESQAELGDQFKLSDFPTKEEVEASFSFKWRVVNFGTPGHLQSVSPEIFELEKAKAQAEYLEALDIVRQGQLILFQGLTQKCVERLTPDTDGRRKNLHKSTVDSLQNAIAAFDLNNVTDFNELKAQVDVIKNLISGVSLEQLKHNDTLKESLHSATQDILGNLNILIEKQSGRKFRY